MLIRQISWIRSNDTWYSLANVDLTSWTKIAGVYVIWHGGTASKVVKVGQGNIEHELKQYRGDRKFQAYRCFGLYVTWASVASQADRDGIQRYLADLYRPLLNDNPPTASPIAVNLPLD
jgi:hypothetical protein